MFCFSSSINQAKIAVWLQHHDNGSLQNPTAWLPRTVRTCFHVVLVCGQVPRQESVIMPIYEYVCQDCGHEFEYLVRGSERPSCPACEKGSLTKKMSVPAAHVAGGGELPQCPSGSCGSCGMLDPSSGDCGLGR